MSRSNGVQSMRLVFAVFYIPALLMDIHQAVSDFIVQGGELLSRLRSYEGEMLSDADLHLLRVELHLLDGEAAHLQRESQVRPKKSA